jgi:Putative 2OG-Fe(II) oxygenase
VHPEKAALWFHQLDMLRDEATRFMDKEVFGLFPTPLWRVRGLLSSAMVDQLVVAFTPQAVEPNTSSRQLSHSKLVAPDDHALLVEANRLVLPHLVDFGELLLGERLTWAIKEMWVNVLETGGHQTRHNHANSFISGVLYLTTTHASAQTVFLKAPGGTDFVFSNANERSKLNAYNAGKWVSPAPAPGDMVLFPSYLLHEVPVNAGGRRISLAFNAIPNRIDCWGYSLTLFR